jgi:hypothetical protein
VERLSLNIYKKTLEDDDSSDSLTSNILTAFEIGSYKV